MCIYHSNTYYILYTDFGILRHHRQDFEIRTKQLTVRTGIWLMRYFFTFYNLLLSIEQTLSIKILPFKINLLDPWQFNIIFCALIFDSLTVSTPNLYTVLSSSITVTC